MFFPNYCESKICISCVWKQINFDRERAHLSKRNTKRTSGKNLVSAVKNQKVFTIIWKHEKKMVESEIRIHYLVYLTIVPIHKCNIEASNDSADMKSAPHGKFHEKEKNSTIDLKICFSLIIFWLKIKI